MKKLLIITPHLSTGGAPQVTANKVILLKDSIDILLVEYNFLSSSYVVQRNIIKDLVNFKSLGKNKSLELRQIIDDFKPDVVSMEEFPEMFMDEATSEWLYRIDRAYTIIETTHDSSFSPLNKKYMPDKFVFVSPYNVLKYTHLNIPYEVIEYPIDKKEQNKTNKLGFQDYKHVVIIGLFTPRKNQKYAFELCEKTSEYKIKYHFIGNTADNFKGYWQPLLDAKPKDCIIWGERSDISEFLNEADLFLFPSKGDMNNKELNPIVIKEALEYDSLPKLMYNLDVYLNRYEGLHNMNYLTGDLDTDAKKIIELLNPRPIINELVILGTYPNLKSRVQLTKDTVISLKALGRKIMLVSHYPVDADIQKMVDYYIYDANNPLCHHSYYTRFYRYNDSFRVELMINGLKDSNQSLTVLTNMFNAVKMAKNLGYRSFFYTTYDVVIHENDIPIINLGFDKILDTNAYLGTLDTPFGKGIQTNGMFYNTDFFLDTFDYVRDAKQYNDVCHKNLCENFLEDYLAKKLNNKDVIKIDSEANTLLVNSGLGISSNSEYYSILPVLPIDNKYMFYFFSYNVDDRKVNVAIKEDGSEFFNSRFQISKTNEFKKEFVYNGKPIEIILEFYDDDIVYKTENYFLNSDNIELYKKTGSFEKLNVKPKIKLVHIQTTLNAEKEQRSRESLQMVTDYGIEYILHTNEPYMDLPPKFNCIRPNCVSTQLFDKDTINKLGTALTPAHYGCYESFKNAILTEFHDCDYLIVCEGDCIIEPPIEEFCNAVYAAAKTIKENNIGYFSFGDTKTLEQGWVQSPVIQDINDSCFITNHIIGLQCVMFPSFTKDWLKNQMRTHKWDAADIYFNIIFGLSPYKMGIVKNRLTTQADGFSLIDNTIKSFI